MSKTHRSPYLREEKKIRDPRKERKTAKRMTKDKLHQLLDQAELDEQEDLEEENEERWADFLRMESANDMENEESNSHMN